MYFALKPFIDNDVVPALATFKGVTERSISMPGQEWCSELMIGDTQHDVSTFLIFQTGQV
jgi:hypothetical protein